MSGVGAAWTLPNGFAARLRCSKMRNGCGPWDPRHPRAGGDRPRCGWSTRRRCAVRSRWLEWTPGSGITEKTPNPEPTKATKPGSVGFVGTAPAHFSITCDSESRSDRDREGKRPESQVANERECRPATIPAGALLIAPRFDGLGNPLESVPQCWCCGARYALDRLKESKGKTYAWLEPGCGCLNTGMCYRCFVCRAHCRCEQPCT